MAFNVDHLIVGAGPAGLALAGRLTASGAPRVLVVEKGTQQALRDCAAVRLGHCGNCAKCDVLSGVGGASGTIGGKLCFFPAGSGILDHTGVNEAEANQEVAAFLRAAGVPVVAPAPVCSPDDAWYGRLEHKQYSSQPISRRTLVQALARATAQARRGGAHIRTGAEVTDVRPRSTGGFDVWIRDGAAVERIAVNATVTIAGGRSCQALVQRLVDTAHLVAAFDQVDVGVRLEFPSRRIDDQLPQGLQDPKIKTSGGLLRTLCWCRGGSLGAVGPVGMWHSTLVDGHFGDATTDRTSVSLVAREQVSGHGTAMDHALLQMGGGQEQTSLISYQDVAGFLGMGRDFPPQSDPPHQAFRARRVNFTRLIQSPLYSRLAGLLLELDEALGKGSLVNRESYVYGPVVDRTWHKVVLDKRLMSAAVPGLFFAGDAAGLGRGIVQSIMTGLFVAEQIALWEAGNCMETAPIEKDANAVR